MKKVLLICLLFSFLVCGCSPKDEIKDGTHNDDGIVYHQSLKDRYL